MPGAEADMHRNGRISMQVEGNVHNDGPEWRKFKLRHYQIARNCASAIKRITLPEINQNPATSKNLSSQIVADSSTISTVTICYLTQSQFVPPLSANTLPVHTTHRFQDDGERASERAHRTKGRDATKAIVAI